jgi:hypothetical protein
VLTELEGTLSFSISRSRVLEDLALPSKTDELLDSLRKEEDSP